MANKNFIETEGTVIEVLSNSMFRVKLDQEGVQPVTAYLSGKIRKHRIKILLGDKVLLQISPHDTTKGRITYRR